MLTPNPTLINVGDFADDTWLNQLVKSAFFAIGPPMAQYYPTTSANLDVAANAWQVIGLDTKYYDRDAFSQVAQWSLAHPTRLVFNYTATYEVRAHVVWPSAGTGNRRAMIRYGANGNVALGTHLDEAQSDIDPIGSTTRLRLFANVSAIAGQYVELFAWQNSAGVQSLVSGNVATWLSIKLASGAPNA